MQIDLSPKSKDQFDRYIRSRRYNIGKGLVTAEDAKILEMRTEIATNSNNQKYTLVKFSTQTQLTCQVGSLFTASVKPASFIYASIQVGSFFFFLIVTLACGAARCMPAN